MHAFKLPNGHEHTSRTKQTRVNMGISQCRSSKIHKAQRCCVLEYTSASIVMRTRACLVKVKSRRPGSKLAAVVVGRRQFIELHSPHSSPPLPELPVGSFRRCYYGPQTTPYADGGSARCRQKGRDRPAKAVSLGQLPQHPGRRNLHFVVRPEARPHGVVPCSRCYA